MAKKKLYRVKKQWRCVGYEGDVFFRDSEKAAKRDNDQGYPDDVCWAVVHGSATNAEVVADCYSEADAQKVRDALNAVEAS